MYQRRDFYRHARYVHGWLSAFAFIVLIFFAATGLFLNNPDWFKSKNEEQTTTFTLPPTLVASLQKQENPSYSHTGGYLKEFDYKEAFTKSVTEASKEDRDLIRALPNFNADIFLEISGVDLRLLDTNEI